MKAKWLFYGLLFLIIAVSVSWRIDARKQAVQVLKYDIEQTALNVFFARGFQEFPDAEEEIHAYSQFRRSIFEPLSHPNCKGPVIFMIRNIKPSSSGIIKRFMRDDLALRFIHFDKSWDSQKRVWKTLNWLKIALFSRLGNDKWLPSQQAILLIADKDCAEVHSDDWSEIWYKSTHKPFSNQGES